MASKPVWIRPSLGWRTARRDYVSHRVNHLALVIGAAALQYAVVAFYVVPNA